MTRFCVNSREDIVRFGKSYGYFQLLIRMVKRKVKGLGERLQYTGEKIKSIKNIIALFMNWLLNKWQDLKFLREPFLGKFVEKNIFVLTVCS